jgi:predicted nucleotidyltransferase component of viral defense system
MLDVTERRRTAEEFQVAGEQVARDHLISHILAALPSLKQGLVFYGGTALARTHLPKFRLSEDVDLLAKDRVSAAAALERILPRVLRREFGAVRWLVGPSAVRSEVVPALLTTEEGLQVRIQLGTLDSDRSRWPTEVRAIYMRYGDVASIELTVPTLTAFAAMKSLAWEDQHAARDLADLFALNRMGTVDPAVIDLLRKVVGRAVHPATFLSMPESTRMTWSIQLDHQMATTPDPDQSLKEVHRAWVRAING